MEVLSPPTSLTIIIESPNLQLDRLVRHVGTMHIEHNANKVDEPGNIGEMV